MFNGGHNSDIAPTSACAYALRFTIRGHNTDYVNSECGRLSGLSVYGFRDLTWQSSFSLDLQIMQSVQYLARISAQPHTSIIHAFCDSNSIRVSMTVMHVWESFRRRYQ